ncbi:MAG: carotenoid oxygenase family protein, partial [Acidimicrobiales bacterium]
SAGRPYRFAYSCLGTPGWFLFDGVVRHDVVTGDEQVYRYGPGVYGSEVAVAPRPGGTDESDAYLVTLTTDMVRGCSECLVFDAADVAGGPVARLRLPARIPSGTHACWAAPGAVPGWEN